MKRLVIILAVLALCVGLASASKRVATPATEFEGPSRANTVVWFDDVEGGDLGYFSTDLGAGGGTIHWHIDTYMAYEGTYSWWCGSFDYDANGGYGNSWDDRLDIPPLDLSTATMPVLTYAFRNDTELTYDFSYVQAESLGAFVNLNKGYDGLHAWTDIGVFGFLMAAYDNPMVARFRFVSDGAWSDEDGDDTVGGAFAVDIVKVFDYMGGYTFFYDDAETGGLCTPSAPAAAGDWWHIIDRLCPAYSDPHSWWCGDDADTSLLPGNLQDALFSPYIDITGAYACTAHFAMHFAVATVDNDYCSMYVNVDHTGYFSLGGWWGDFGTCDGWGGTAYNTGFDVTQAGPGGPYSVGEFVWIMYSTDNGCFGAAGDAGIMIDDIWFEVDYEPPVAVQDKSWGSIKRLYR